MHINQITLLIGLFFACNSIFTYCIAQVNHSFVGVEVCVMCHKTEKQGKQLEIWKNSKHSQAYHTLKSEESKKIAEEMNLPAPAIESKECLRCHTSGYDANENLIGKKFKVEDGVQCETCHGAGSDYKDLKVMKNREEAIKNGLFLPDSKEEFCKDCHNSESPTFKEFDFEKAWTSIQHYIPKEQQK